MLQMIDWIKCFLGFHDYSEWTEREETAGLGTHVYHMRYCIHCDRTSHKGLG